MRRFTMILIVLLLLSLVGAGLFQVLLVDRGEGDLPGPTVSSTP